MKHRRRNYYTETDKALMWDRWQKGDSLHAIARARHRDVLSQSRALTSAGLLQEIELVDWYPRCLTDNGNILVILTAPDGVAILPYNLTGRRHFQQTTVIRFCNQGVAVGQALLC